MLLFDRPWRPSALSPGLDDRKPTFTCAPEPPPSRSPVAAVPLRGTWASAVAAVASTERLIRATPASTSPSAGTALALVVTDRLRILLPPPGSSLDDARPASTPHRPCALPLSTRPCGPRSRARHRSPC